MDLKPVKRVKADMARLYKDGIWESLRLNLAAVARGWLGLVSVASVVLGITFSVFNASVPAWVFWIIAVVAVVVAQFLAFHNEREKGSELGGALYLLNVEWAVVAKDGTVTVQPTLQFRNTSQRQIRYELLDYSLAIGGKSGGTEFNNQSGWIGAGQDAGFRLPEVQGLPTGEVYEGFLFYRFVYTSPRIKRYEHRTGRRLKVFIVLGKDAATTLWAYEGSGEEETIRR